MIEFRQTPPGEELTPDWFFDEMSGAAIDGGREFCDYIPDDVKRVFDSLEDSYYIISDYKEYGYKNITESVNDYFRREDGKPFTTRQIHNIKIAIELYARDRGSDAETARVMMLDVCIGGKWAVKTIRGCVQREWATVYYNTDIHNMDYIYTLEAFFFGDFSEWIDADGVGYYVTGAQDARAELAAQYGYAPEDVLLMEFSGYKRVAQWQEVPA